MPGCRTQVLGTGGKLRGSHHQVLGDGKRFDQHELLMDHADARIDGVRGIFELDRHAIEVHAAFRRLINAVKDVHERGFAGAVLAQYGVHFALADIKIDTIIGKDLGDRTAW